jgi:ankyrin repeat protein
MNLPLAETSVTDDLCFTPLHHVITGIEKADLCQQLRLNSSFVNSPDTLGRSALHWAAIRGNSSAIEVLLAHGASPNYRDKEQMSPLHEIYQAPQSSQAGCTRLLIDSGADVNAKDSWGRTALRISVAFATSSLDFIEMLIKEGAAVDVRDIYGQTALLKSIRGNPQITQLLLKNGANINAKDIYGNTPLSEAISRNKNKSLNLLLDYGADIDQLLELQVKHHTREGDVDILHSTACHGDIEGMRAPEESEHHSSFSTRPIDEVEKHLKHRLGGRKYTRGVDRETVVHLLSHVVCSREKGQNFSNSEDEDSDEGEEFVDAKEYPQDNFSIV